MGDRVTALLDWVDGLPDAVPAVAVAAVVARRLALDSGLPVDERAPALVRQVGSGLELPTGIAVEAGDLGLVYERRLDAAHRHEMGVHYTPADVARGLVELALDGRSWARVCDPSVGGGAFLLAAAEALEAAGADPETIVVQLLWGIDVDPDAIEVTRAALALWGSRSSRWIGPAGHLACADTLDVGASAFGSEALGFDVVVGNPPFQNQLQAATARDPAFSGALRDRWDTTAGPYADTAAFFLLAGVELTAPGGRCVLVQPESVLGSADARPIRRQLTENSALIGLWAGGDGVFGADVRVWAPVLGVGDAPPATLGRWVGESFVPAPTRPPPDLRETWSPLVADLLGVPVLPDAPIAAGATLALDCEATAGFRDEFYGLAPHTHDDRDGVDPRLVTVGMIDPLRNRWGTGSFRYSGERWAHPRVDRSALAAESPRLAQWVADRLGPKVLVATQTRVIEVVVDETGDLVPCTPVIAVVPPPDRLWHAAAALTSPIATAVALTRVAGAALSADTIKLSAKQVLALPTPVDGEAWDDAALLARRGAAAAAAEDEDTWRECLAALGVASLRAYRLDRPDVLAWWLERLPPWR